MKSFIDWIVLKEAGYYTLEPQDKIASGTEAEVFNTSDPDIVVRVQRKKKKSRCEKILSRPSIQATGGVVAIHGSKNVEGIEYTYKEKVNLNWEKFLQTVYPMHDANEIIEKLLSLKDLDFPRDQEEFDNIKKFLRHVPETTNLVSAIEAGVPIVDLYAHNMGVNRDNKIIIIDC